MAIAPRRGWSDEHDERAEEEGYDSWADWIFAIELEKGHQICGARAKSTDAPCRKTFSRENARGRCKKHGGASLSGPAHASWKHGGYWEAGRGTDLGEIYRRLAEDGDELFDALAEMRLLRAVVIKRWGEFSDGEISFEKLREPLAEYRRFFDSRRRMLEVRADTMDVEEARARFERLMRAMERAIQAHVEDPDEREAAISALSEEFRRLEGHGAASGREIPA